MHKFKLLTVIGARPQFVKSAMFSHELMKTDNINTFNEVIVHTGQHYDNNMSQIFFDELSIPKPNYNLDINGASHAYMTGNMLIKLEELMLAEKPDTVLVYGDTDSTLSGALAAAKLHIPVIHVEAGLRSFNKYMPEEINRIMTDHVSDLLFCPTTLAVANLKNENIKDNVFLVGDIMQDMTNYAVNRSNKEILSKLNLVTKEYLLLTLHRAENTDNIDKLKELLNYTKKFADANGLNVLFPIHPRTRIVCQKNNITLSPFIVCEPQGYFDMQALINNSVYVFTDSGGVQKEAYYHKVPCVTLREQTEWEETITYGWNRLWRVNNYLPRTTISEYEFIQSTSNLIVDNIKEYFAL